MLAPLFSDYRHLRTDIDANLSGYCGNAVANKGDKLVVAKLTNDFVNIFGGNPNHAVASFLIEQLCEKKVFSAVYNLWRKAFGRYGRRYKLKRMAISVPNEAWRNLILSVHGSRITIEKRLSFSSKTLDIEHLRILKSQVPKGFKIKRTDVSLVERMRSEVSKDLISYQIFKSPSDFFERGVGFCAVADDGKIACAATSAVVCDDAIEIQINTNKLFQRMGLATVVGAALIVYCLERKIDPRWETGNSISEKLAKRLGYIPYDSYEWLRLKCAY
jgi:hypothetical protein